MIWQFPYIGDILTRHTIILIMGTSREAAGVGLWQTIKRQRAWDSVTQGSRLKNQTNGAVPVEKTYSETTPKILSWMLPALA